MGIIELGIFLVLATALGLLVAYWLIRLAVRGAIVDAERQLHAEGIRGQLGVGPERTPNSR